MFAWAPIPEPFRHLGSLEFSKLLIEQADVAVAPGVGFGEHGDDYVRIALVENEHRIRQAARNIKRFLAVDRQAAQQRRAARRAPLKARASISRVMRGVVGTWLKHCVSELRASAPSARRWRACCRDKAAELTRQCGRADRRHRRFGARRATRPRRRSVGAAKWFDDPVEACARRPTSTSSSN